MDPTRRDFLIVGGRILVMTAASAAALEHVVAGTPQAAETYSLVDHWWAMAIDVRKCIGCGTCVQACKAENGVVDEPFYFRTWIERYHIDPSDLEHPIVDSPNGGRDGFPEKYPDGVGKTFFVPKLCNQCSHSPCVQVCPVGATFVTPDGVVLVDKDYCVGCRYCIQACPYGSRYLDPRTHVADKCTLCYHRITKGLTTACVEVCPTGARQLADLKNPDDPIHAFLRENAVDVLKPQMATGAKVYYAALDGSVR
jgi:Fe-S-cluster-containing dehydrogenase component